MEYCAELLDWEDSWKLTIHQNTCATIPLLHIMRGTKKAHSPVLRIDYNEAASELPVPVRDEVIDFLTRADALDRHIANRNRVHAVARYPTKSPRCVRTRSVSSAKTTNNPSFVSSSTRCVESIVRFSGSCLEA